MKKRVIIGITGGFAAGKSTAASAFGRLGAGIICADKIAHKAIMPGGGAYKRVVSLFGPSILARDGAIDRGKLGRRAFGDPDKLARLNSVVHPVVIADIKAAIKKMPACKKAVVIDAPLLIEAGLKDMVDKLVVVSAARNVQIKRAQAKHRLSRSEIERRIRSQMPISKKKRMADFIIDNNGLVADVRKKVKKIWREIRDGAE